jgi:DNA-binding CsgD family transcriptional regulator
MKTKDQKYALACFKNAGETTKDDLNILKTYLGISQFAYCKMFYNNKYFFISSDPKITDDFVSNTSSNFAQSFKTMQPQKGYRTITWPRDPNSLVTYQAYLSECKKNNYWNGITFFRRGKDHVELFSFASEIQNTLASNFYGDNTKILLAFVQYWLNKNTTNSILDKPTPLATFVNGVDFSNLDKMELEIIAERDKLKQFLDLTRQGGTNIYTKTGFAHITAREMECLDLLSQCNTVKEVARSLNISSRTVEGHVNNIRSKGGLLYKSDLIKLYRKQIIDLEL